MSKGNATNNDLVKFYANSVPMPAYGSAWFIHLHTDDPADRSSSNEAEYADYAPVAVNRDAAGFTICDGDGTPNPSGVAFKNTAAVTFNECNASFSPKSEIITHASLCSSRGQIIYKGVLSPPISVTALYTPRIPAGGAIFKEGCDH